MLYLLAPHLEKFWGPFRLLRSHALLLAIGTLLAAFAVVLLLPKLWPLSPRDHGKAILGKDGMKSAGKPTGTGLWVTLILLPIVLLVMPLSVPGWQITGRRGWPAVGSIPRPRSGRPKGRLRLSGN